MTPLTQDNSIFYRVPTIREFLPRVDMMSVECHCCLSSLITLLTHIPPIQSNSPLIQLEDASSPFLVSHFLRRIFPSISLFEFHYYRSLRYKRKASPPLQKFFSSVLFITKERAGTPSTRRSFVLPPQKGFKPIFGQNFFFDFFEIERSFSI